MESTIQSCILCLRPAALPNVSRLLVLLIYMVGHRIRNFLFIQLNGGMVILMFTEFLPKVGESNDLQAQPVLMTGLNTVLMENIFILIRYEVVRCSSGE